MRRMPFPLPCLLALLALPLAPAARAGELRNFEDAALHAVQFWDHREGWAVGDEGVVWHTIDGGTSWERHPTGVRASLRSLHFVNPTVGWVAGREELPGGGSAGVLLYTRDGGWHWQRGLPNALPGLNVVRFVEDRVGYLAGDGSDQFPSGVFTTTDGKAWKPLPGPRCPSWLAADFARDSGALAGAWDRLATARNGQVFAVDQDTLGGRNLRGVRLLGEGGVAVGQGGLVMLSRKGTRRTKWDFFRLRLASDAERDWDFHAVHGAGSHIWAIGRPGSVALHSPDGGRRWEVVRTGQALPLNGVFFRDEQHGWAVGELGTVLATSDGGKTWRVQRRGGQRMALLFAHARAAGTPLDTVALLGGQEGYLAAGLRVTAPDSASAALGRSTEGLRFGFAFRQAGGAAGEMLWQFPIPSHLARCGRADLLRAWDARHGDRAAEQLLRQLVLAVRMWRPDVVVTDDPDPSSSDSAAEGLLAEAVREAFKRAADPTTFPEQLSVLGLEAWKAGKLYALSAGSRGAAVVLEGEGVCAALGSTAREFAAGPAALLGGPTVSIPAERRYRLLAAHLAGAAGHRALMQGVALAPGGTARRPVTATEAAPEVLKGVRQRANLRLLAETPAGKLTDPNKLLAQTGPMLQGMREDQAAPAAYAVGRLYARRGQWSLAREAFLLLVDRYPTHPLAAEAYRWLLRHNSSSEAKRRHELGQFLVLSQLQFGMPAPTAGPPRPQDPQPGEEAFPRPGSKNAKGKGGRAPREGKLPEVPRTEVREKQQFLNFSSNADARKWYQGSLEVEKRLAAFGSLFTNDPAVQFCLQSARRNLGDLETPRKWYAQFASRQPDGPWRSAALAELWLANRTGAPPRPVLSCPLVESRPYLDGKLDDPCWQQAPAAKLGDAAGKTREQYPTEVRLAHDAEFLYVAVRCGHPAGEAEVPSKVRTRDSDLRGFDRVSLLLDLDRDYSTCYHLQIDRRGCVAEDCWGDRTWDPRWFVAVRHEPAAWVAEVAIPLAALSGDGVTSGRAWAANVVRVLPGRGVQAWSLPAEAPEESLRPEGMGLLLFTQAARSERRYTLRE